MSTDDDTYAGNTRASFSCDGRMVAVAAIAGRSWPADAPRVHALDQTSEKPCVGITAHKQRMTADARRNPILRSVKL